MGAQLGGVVGAKESYPEGVVIPGCSGWQQSRRHGRGTAAAPSNAGIITKGGARLPPQRSGGESGRGLGRIYEEAA